MDGRYTIHLIASEPHMCHSPHAGTMDAFFTKMGSSTISNLGLSHDAAESSKNAGIGQSQTQPKPHVGKYKKHEELEDDDDKGIGKTHFRNIPHSWRRLIDTALEGFDGGKSRLLTSRR
jgi:hypothetical protein